MLKRNQSTFQHIWTPSWICISEVFFFLVWNVCCLCVLCGKSINNILATKNVSPMPNRNSNRSFQVGCLLWLCATLSVMSKQFIADELTYHSIRFLIFQFINNKFGFCLHWIRWCVRSSQTSTIKMRIQNAKTTVYFHSF